jgi:hypothetical protein
MAMRPNKCHLGQRLLHCCSKKGNSIEASFFYSGFFYCEGCVISQSLI